MQGMTSTPGPPHATGVWIPVIQKLSFRRYSRHMADTTMTRQTTGTAATGKSATVLPDPDDAWSATVTQQRVRDTLIYARKPDSRDESMIEMQSRTLLFPRPYLRRTEKLP